MSQKFLRVASAALITSLVTLAISPAQAAGDVAAGEKIYTSKCTVCHALDANKIGPLSRGVFGRKAGTAAGYSYSAGVKALNVTWDEASLDKWLTNPSAMATGTKMAFRLNEAKDRADVIAYLKSLNAKK